MPSFDSSWPRFQSRLCGKFLFVEFPSGRTLVMLGWPVLKAWVKHPNNEEGWSPCRPDLDVTTGMVGCQTFRVWENPVVRMRVRLSRMPCEAAMRGWREFLKSLKPVHRYFETIPPDVRAAVSKYTNGQWNLLKLAAQGGDRAVDLMESNPALAYLVASSHCDSHVRHERLPNLLGMRRRQIAGRMAFPATGSAVRLLAKVPAEHCRVRWLTVLAKRLAYPRLGKCLLHLPVVNAAVMRALCATPALRSITPSLLVELSKVEGDPEMQTRFGRLLE